MGRRPKNRLDDAKPIKIQKFKTPLIVRGMKDILPSEQIYFDFIQKKIDEITKKYSYKRIETPIVEEKSLFQRALGKHSNLITKEMFCFSESSGNNVCLRPEGTAAVVRAYIKHGMQAMLQPIRMYYVGNMFRYERPQSGHQREFRQFGLEALGEKNPVLDAQLILINYNFLNELNLKVKLYINSIGCPVCRPNYARELTKFLKRKRSRLCGECKKNLNKNPLKILACEEKSCDFVKEESPQIVDWLCEECKSHFVKVLEYLDELDVPYELNPYLVRNLNYYTKTIFEIHPDEAGNSESSKESLSAGGRYDNLVEVLGGKPAPACGFAVGIERVIAQLKKQNAVIPQGDSPYVFVAQLGDAAKTKCLKLFEELHKENIIAVENFSVDNLKAQLDMANKLKVKYILILGQKEVLDKTILIRDTEGGMQEVIDFKKVIPELKKKLEEEKKV
ncbi:MAG: histidine--tRNA ligase [bacterium]